MKWPDMSGVEKALAEYYDDGPRRDRMWKEADTNAAVAACVSADALALFKVRTAFAEATKDRNTWSQCKVVTIDFVRKCVEGWREEQRNA